MTKERDNYYDNLRAVLLLLVAFGHMIEPMVKRFDLLVEVALYINIVAIPLFVFAAGVFFKPGLENKMLSKLLLKLLLPYLILQVLYTLFHNFAYHGWSFHSDSFRLHLLNPYWLLWFLLSMFLWRLMMPFMLMLRFPLITALVLALLCGIDRKIGSQFAMSRTFVYLPFFMLGYYAKGQDLSWLRHIWARSTALAVFLALPWLLDLFQLIGLDSNWFKGAYAYALFQVSWYEGIFLRAMTYVVSIFLCLAIMAWVPQRRTVISVIGEYSLVVYLFHGFFVRFGAANGMHGAIETEWQLLVFILAAFGVCFVIVLPPVRRLCEFIISPPLLRRLLKG